MLYINIIIENNDQVMQGIRKMAGIRRIRGWLAEPFNYRKRNIKKITPKCIKAAKKRRLSLNFLILALIYNVFN